jgi:putative two-component system response regulator
MSGLARAGSVDSIAVPRQARQGRILIADDDQAIVGLLERILARAGFADVTVTTDSDSVIDLFSELSPDLVVLDLVMPPPDGFELMARLAEIIPEDAFVPILVLTGNLSTETRRRALGEGATDLLTKPFDVTEVLLRIRNLLATRFLHLETMAHNRILDATVRQRTQKLEEARLDVLARLARAAEFRDDETGEHTRRVGVLSSVLGARLGMTDVDVENLRLTAPLHDVGKIGIPDGILLKPGRLTPGERAIMETHTTIGATLLSDSPWPVLRYAAEVALRHHEWWDGGGYPDGLAGEAIPLAARIVAVVDVFDALSHDRPYRSAWPRGQVLEEIRSGRGTHFDPQVVDAFLGVCGPNGDPLSISGEAV